MGKVEVDGKALELDIGEAIDGESEENQTT